MASTGAICDSGEGNGDTSDVDEALSPANMLWLRPRRGNAVRTGDPFPTISPSTSVSKRTSFGERSALLGEREVARSVLVGDLEATRADLGGGEEVLGTRVGL